MCRASELIICFNIRSAGCDLVGRHGAKRTGCGHKQAGLQVKTGEQSACRSSLALKRVTGLRNERKVIGVRDVQWSEYGIMIEPR